jgi:hypothetical protein
MILSGTDARGGVQAVLTGPGFVEVENVDAIADLAAEGTR